MTDAFDATNDATYDRRYVEVSSGQNYDNIGNRFKSRIGTGAGTPVSTYFPNELNQYDTVTQTNPVSGRGFLYDADGNMTASYVAMDIDGDGDVDSTDLSMMSAMYGYTCSTWTGDMAEFLRGDIDGDCDIDINDWGVLLSLYGTTGDLSLEHAFTWDAENRLTKIAPVTPTSGSKRIEFKYDYRGRRVEKAVTLWNSGGSPAAWYDHPTETRRFVWNGWLMLRETIETDAASDGTVDSARTKTYTWGKDLANGGSRGGTGVSPVMLESAGGIGGLLSVYDDNATTTGGSPTADDLAYVYMYDANGNVGQLCDVTQSTASASITAKFEYDAYGNAIVSSGAYATSNTYRFSTKPWDDEAGLGYWGYRYYDPRLGRWMSRDPIGGPDAPSFHLAFSNDAAFHIDPDGRLSIAVTPVVGILAGAAAIAAALCATPHVLYVQSQGAAVWTNDKYAHCVVSCRLSKACTNLFSLAGGYSKEVIDEIKKRAGEGGRGFDWVDIAANNAGRNCSGVSGYLPVVGWTFCWIGESCHDCCAKKHPPHPISMPPAQRPPTPMPRCVPPPEECESPGAGFWRGRG